MSMPHLNFLDIWGSSFKSFKKVSNLKLNLKSKIEDCTLNLSDFRTGNIKFKVTPVLNEGWG